MGLFSSTSNKKRIELVCDIGNRSVGYSLVEYFFDEKAPNIIFSDRIYSPYKEVKSSENTISVFTRDLNILLNNAVKHCISIGLKPVRVSCFYSSPWYIAQTHILKIKQSEPIVFSETIIRKILDEGEKNFLSEETAKEHSFDLKDLKLIERRITSIKLNGYQTHKPFGKKASNVEASVFFGAVPKEIIALVEDVIDHMWHKIKVQHHTFPIASFSLLRSEFNTTASFLVAHIADDITDIYLVNNGILLDTFSFPLGKRNIIESIQKTCKIDYELATSALSMNSKNEINSNSLECLDGAMRFTKKDWTTHFENSYSVLTKKSVLPEIIYLISDERVFPFFESVIKNLAQGGYATANKELKVSPIAKNLFEKYITYSSPPHTDFFLETEVLYINFISTKEDVIINNYILE
jgi:hypothetical protein